MDKQNDTKELSDREFLEKRDPNNIIWYEKVYD